MDNEDGGIRMLTSGMKHFHNFPRCEKVESLRELISEWQLDCSKYGGGIPDMQLNTMFRNILPEHMENELGKRPEIDTLQKKTITSG